MNPFSVLVVDDELSQLGVLSGYLRKQGYRVFPAGEAEKALEIARGNLIDVVLTDMRLPGLSGIELVRELNRLNPDIAVVVMTAYGSIGDAVAAMKAGAEDYLTKPVDLDQLTLVLNKLVLKKKILAENERLKQTLASRFQFPALVLGSPVMQEAVNLAARAAESKATVLLRGESGTGKEVFARAIHQAGPRKDMPFIAVNVGALPETLMESELFGHEKGAFTGADRQRQGRFELADGGTLFIDEVGDISMQAQVKLLRVIQEKTFERLGGRETLKADVRLIAATHQHLETLIPEGRFREDLFYRLNVICIRIPPLRERREDIPLLADHFLRRFREEEGREVRTVSREAMDVLMKHAYPGNVRELENIIQRAVVLSRTDVIGLEDLPFHIRALPGESAQKDADASLGGRLKNLETTLIKEALSASGGNKSEAARSLGISERHLRYRMKKYGLN
ncbi:sigma-54-dependent Fis family transcriptional regulator [bacterium]|nr:sigma-54-dependent Fis family transcriptional regulator [bacterium]